VRHIKNFELLLLLLTELFLLWECFSITLLFILIAFPCFESWTLTALVFWGLVTISLPLALLHVELSVEILLTIATASTGGGFDFCPELFLVEVLTHFSMALDF
jgi:hypothetical protein